MKFKYTFFLILGLILVSCSENPVVTEVDYPDAAEVSTLISKTLTQIATENIEPIKEPQDTPQPTELKSTGYPTAQFFTLTPTDPFRTAESTESTTTTDITAEDLTSQASGTETPNQTEEPSLPGIPGLYPGAIMDRLVGIGFVCSEPDVKDGQIIWECIYGTSDFLYKMSIWGSTVETVDLIEAAALYFGDLDYTDLTSIIFEMMAVTISQGNASDEVSAWIRDTLPDIQVIGDEAIQSFGGVSYHLYAFPSAQVLEVGNFQ